MNYVDKTMLLITFMRRALENKMQDDPPDFPRIIFFDKIEEIDKCYREAYDFHLKLT